LVGLDTLIGGLGRDTPSGGLGRDLFDFNSIRDSVVGSQRDVITDFHRGNNVTGDDIDFRTIDANAKLFGNQTFKWIGAQAFHKKAGELHYKDAGPHVIVEGDVNGDAKADFQIAVLNVNALGAGDFLL
jgi:Ca2+-binding RTX toxin-like protein